MRMALLKMVMILIMVAVVGLPNGVVVVRDGSEVDRKERGTVGYVDDGEVMEGERGHDWEIETVDYTGGGKSNLIEVDSFNQPHIIYYTTQDTGYKYARFDDEQWHYEYVNLDGDIETNVRMALDSNNRVHIGYRDDDTEILKYAYHDGKRWKAEIVDSHVQIALLSIAIDDQDRPHISYHDTTNYYLKYAYYDGATWQIETVDSERRTGFWPEIALDHDGGVHICYAEYDWPDILMKYAYFDGDQWHIETVDPDHSGGFSLAVDTHNKPHICYSEDDYNVLKYMYFNGTRWINETVATGDKVGSSASISLDT